MKKTLLLMTAATALSGGFSLSAGKPVPYQSDFYIDYSLDDGWQTKNNVRRGGISWSAAGISDDLLTLGAKGAAVKIYSSDHTQTADSWLISPAVDVTAGTEYTVKVYAAPLPPMVRQSVSKSPPPHLPTLTTSRPAP